MLQETLQVLSTQEKLTFAFLAEILSHAAEAKLTATHIERAFFVMLFREAATFCIGIAVAPALVVR
jgi:hypothetical protein